MAAPIDLLSVFLVVQDKFPVDTLCVVSTLSRAYNAHMKTAIGQRSAERIGREIYYKLVDIEDEFQRLARLELIPPKFLKPLLREISWNVLYCNVACYPHALQYGVTIDMLVEKPFSDNQFRVSTESAIFLPDYIQSMYFYLRTPLDVCKTVMTTTDMVVHEYALKYQALDNCSLIDVQWTIRGFSIVSVDCKRLVRSLTRRVDVSSYDWEQRCQSLCEGAVFVESIRDRNSLIETASDLITSLEF